MISTVSCGAALALGAISTEPSATAQPAEDGDGDAPPRTSTDPTGCHLLLYLHVDVSLPYWGVTPVTLQER